MQVINLYFFIVSQLHEANDIFHSSLTERDNLCSAQGSNKRRAVSGGGERNDDRSINSNALDEFSAAAHKRAKSDVGKSHATTKDSNNSPPLPG